MKRFKLKKGKEELNYTGRQSLVGHFVGQ